MITTWWTNPVWWHAIGEIATALFTLGLAIIAWWQLNSLRNSNTLQTVLTIETQLNERKMQFDKIGTDIRISETKGETENIGTIMAELFQSAKENYFNALDRLCFCIKKEYIKERDWKVEYREYLNNVVRTYEQDFGEASPYRHIKNLNRKWQSE